MQNERKLAIVDKNRDLYLTNVRKVSSTESIDKYTHNVLYNVQLYSSSHGKHYFAARA